MPRMSEFKPYYARRFISALLQKKWRNWKMMSIRLKKDPFDIDWVREYLVSKFLD
jgi:hypothetical protein